MGLEPLRSGEGLQAHVYGCYGVVVVVCGNVVVVAPAVVVVAPAVVVVGGVLQPVTQNTLRA